MHTYTHTGIHIYIRECIHAYTHAHMHTYRQEERHPASQAVISANPICATSEAYALRLGLCAWVLQCKYQTSNIFVLLLELHNGRRGEEGEAEEMRGTVMGMRREEEGGEEKGREEEVMRDRDRRTTYRETMT